MGYDPSRKTFRQGILGAGDSIAGTRSVLLGPDEARTWQEQMGFIKLFFGVPLPEAIELGYRISRRGAFETTNSCIAQAMAAEAKRLLVAMKCDDQRVADLFAGLGSCTWAFAAEGFVVHAVEQDPATAAYAQANIAQAGLAEKVVVAQNDALNTIAEAKARSEQYAAIFLDPPWNGTYNYDLRVPFYLSDTAPGLYELVQATAPLASLVTVKAPANIDMCEVRTLGDSIGHGTLTLMHSIEGYPPETQAAAIHFSAALNGHLIEHIELPRPRSPNP